MRVHRGRTPPYQAERRDESDRLPLLQYVFITVQNNSSFFFISFTPTTRFTHIDIKLCPDSHITCHYRLLPIDPPYVWTNAQTSIGFTNSIVEWRDQLNSRVESQDQCSQNHIIVFPLLHLPHSTQSASASVLIVAHSGHDKLNTSIVLFDPQDAIPSPYSHVQAN